MGRGIGGFKLKMAEMNVQGLGKRGAVNVEKLQRIIKLGVNVLVVIETWLRSFVADTQVELALRGTGWRWIGRKRRHQANRGRPNSRVSILYKDEVGIVEERKDQGVDGLTWATILNGETKTSVVGLYFILSNSSRKRVEHNEKLAAAEADDPPHWREGLWTW